MISPTRTFRWPTTGHTLFIVLMLTGIASADENLRPPCGIRRQELSVDLGLRIAVEEEAYEDAARLRDEIQTLETGQEFDSSEFESGRESK